MVPLIQALQQRSQAWADSEIHRARKRLTRGDDIENVLQGLAQAMSQKMLHGTLAELQTSQGAQRDELMRLLGRLFLRHSADNNPNL